MVTFFLLLQLFLIISQLRLAGDITQHDLNLCKTHIAARYRSVLHKTIPLTTRKIFPMHCLHQPPEEEKEKKIISQSPQKQNLF